MSRASADGSGRGGFVRLRRSDVAQFADGEDGSPVRHCGPAVLAHQEACAGVCELSGHFDVGHARIDRRDGGAEPPGGEQQEHELDAIGQLEGHDIAGSDPEVLEVTCRRLDATQQLNVGEGLAAVRDRGPGGVEGRAAVGQRCEIHGEGVPVSV